MIFKDGDEMLTAFEAAHRRRCGERHFCYVAVRLFPSGECWGIAITADDIDGYVPISDDWFLGTEREMMLKAADLNLKRLDLSRRDVSRIIGASMARSNARAA